MVNPHAGEVEVTVNGVRHIAKLTLGSLAELEVALGDDSLNALVSRFEDGRFRAGDVVALIYAGLRGGGWTGTREDLVQADISGGPIGAAQVAAQLLVRAFAPVGT